MTEGRQAIATLVKAEARFNHQKRQDLRERVLELQGERFTDGHDTTSLDMAITMALALYLGKPTAKAKGKPQQTQPSQSPQPAKRKRGKISFNLNRGRHYVTCLVCGKTFNQRIPDQADLEYSHNRGSPYLGLCNRCDNEQGVSDVKLRYSLPTVKVPPEDITPTDYNLLDGEWLDHYKVAYAYSKKVFYQERADLLHDIILALARRRVKDGRPLDLLRAYRIASLEVALYWRLLKKREQRCCIYSGEPRECYPKACKRNKGGHCEWVAYRPLLSLDQDKVDEQGYITQLRDTIADDNAIDLQAWLEIKTFLLGCPLKVVELATRKHTGKPLKQFEKNYLSRWRKQAQKTMF